MTSSGAGRAKPFCSTQSAIATFAALTRSLLSTVRRISAQVDQKVRRWVLASSKVLLAHSSRSASSLMAKQGVTTSRIEYDWDIGQSLLAAHNLIFAVSNTSAVGDHILDQLIGAPT